MKIKACLLRQLFINEENGYRVILCLPKGKPPKDFELCDDSFTISGNNLQHYEIGSVVQLEVAQLENSKYPASYQVFNNILSKQLFEWKIPQRYWEAIETHYENEESFKYDMSNSMPLNNPYRVLCLYGGIRFEEADKIILNKTEGLKDSELRCYYAVLNILNQNQNEYGDTRLEVEVLKEVMKEDYPDCVKHIDKLNDFGTSKLFDIIITRGYVSKYSIYRSEQNIAQNLKFRNSNPIDSDLHPERYTKISDFDLTEEQRDILKAVSEKSVVMITGNAGVGKTATTKAIIKMLDANNKSYKLFAPTGVASKVLSGYTGKEASTIHMGLATYQRLDCDFVIVDELSMVGVEVFSKLLDITPQETKIIMICDPAQLISISCGNLVQDIIDSNLITIKNLSKVFRYGEGGIATVATDTRNGSVEHLISEFSDYTFVNANNESFDNLLSSYKKLLTKYTKDDILILSPFNKGQYGTLKMNNKIQEIYNEKGMDTGKSKKEYDITINFRIGDKVINTKNDYKAILVEEHDEGWVQEDVGFVANGDIGTIRDIVKFPEIKATFLVIQYDVGFVAVKNVSNLLLGWCITTHKSQGASAKAVIILIDESHNRILSRNLVYVGLSRAEEELILIANKNTVENCLDTQENKERDTWLCEMLKEDKMQK